MHLPINSVLELRDDFLSANAISSLSTLHREQILLDLRWLILCSIFHLTFFLIIYLSSLAAWMKELSFVESLKILFLKLCICSLYLILKFLAVDPIKWCFFFIVCDRGFVYNTSGKAFAFHWAWGFNSAIVSCFIFLLSFTFLYDLMRI